MNGRLKTKGTSVCIWLNFTTLFLSIKIRFCRCINRGNKVEMWETLLILMPVKKVRNSKISDESE
jgi:hypothetical protein